MEFNLNKRDTPNKEYYAEDDLDLTYKFSSKVAKEFGTFIKSLVLFGSSARKDKGKEGDIDVLIVVDDLAIILTAEAAETYRIIMEKLIAETSGRIHVTTMKFTSFWDYARAGDPVAINILRDGVPILDQGFFYPMQLLLQQGRIRPTPEAIWSYYSRAPITMQNSRWHLLQATVDLYWAVIDVSHAALMNQGEVPPSPAHVADMLEQKFVKTKKLDKRYTETVRNFYKLSKMIIKREIREIRGDEYEEYYREAKEYIERMKEFIEY